jgi:hypothetical protein
MIEKAPVVFLYDDYVQSANTLFHFMSKIAYLNKILQERTIIPRYCTENIEYLNINIEGQIFREIAVLQKCFCDIPFHKLADTFALDGVGENFESLTDGEKSELEKNNSHPDYYGKFAVALSKNWGENHHLQPVQYVNEKSTYAMEFSSTFASVLNAENVPEEYTNDILHRLSYIKPLRGIMSRSFERKNSGPVKIELKKNFHDEREWRYVPDSKILAEAKIDCIIANPNILRLTDGLTGINESLETGRYRNLWLDFGYDDIRYIIVPDSQARIDIIDTILSIPTDQFDHPDQAQRERYILMSKILVLDEIRKDW